MADRQPNQLLRAARGSMTQGRLAALVREEIYNATGKESIVSAKSISDWERGVYTWPPAYVRHALCRVLQKTDPADLGFFSRRRIRASRAQEGVSLVDLMDGEPPVAGSKALLVPAGRSFAGVEVEAHYCAVATPDGRWFVVDPGPGAELNRPDRRSLVVLVDEEHRCYVSDGRRFADRAGRRTGPQPVSSAQLLDDMTVGIIWAGLNTDSALLADDAQLSSGVTQLTPHEGRCLFEVPLTEVPTLNPVASQWLTSWFCTRSTARSFDRLAGEPSFWLSGMRPEEAAAWLLWRHRFEYLRHAARWFRGMRCDISVSGADMVDSPNYERVLLLLAAALLEAFRVTVVLSPQTEPGEVGSSALGCGTTVTDTPTGADVCCHAGTAAPLPPTEACDVGDNVPLAVTEQTPQQRLEAIANCLGLSWSWFQRRCSEIAPQGVDGMAHLRSRLLSTQGLNAALRYVANLDDL